jgi:hypothetical protein
MPFPNLIVDGVTTFGAASINPIIAEHTAWNAHRNAGGYNLSNVGTLIANVLTVNSQFNAPNVIVMSTSNGYFQTQSPHLAFYKKTGIYRFYWRRSDTGLAGGTGEAELMSIDDAGMLDVSGGAIVRSTMTATSNVIMSALPSFANNAAAIAAGLPVGALYLALSGDPRPVCRVI